MPELRGYIERITYHNPENGFLVARLKARDRKDLVSVVGHAAQVSAGESVLLQGEWKQDSRYGEQFRFSQMETVVPATAHAIEKYLGSGLIKGIGPRMARQLVQEFGEETLEVIEQEPDRLTRAAGIGPRRVEMITTAWEQQKHVREIMLFLKSYGVGQANCARIYKHYGDRAIELISENPYCLAADIRGIGFKTADTIARNMGIAPDSPLRIQECIVHVLGQGADQGHVYLPREELEERVGAELELQLEGPDLDDYLEALETRDQRLAREEHPELGSLVYLKALQLTEAGLAHKLGVLRVSASALRPLDVPAALDWVRGRLDMELAPAQKQAVASALQEKVTVITGGPGTGKTTIIKAILEILAPLEVRTVLAAPTGRAARRMTEATGHQARTLHRLLKFEPARGAFAYNQDHPLPADVAIVDESSMIDVFLMHHLLRALPLPANLILVGDADQLPSVGPGQVFRDIIASGEFATVTLKEIFRQSRESRIIVNAHRINQGLMPDTRNQSPGSDFFFIQEEDPGRIVNLIIHLCRERIPRRFGFDPGADIQVLSPMHRGETGLGNLNEKLQAALNPRGPALQRGARVLRQGDKVMQVVNNYEKDVFNGDIGLISRVDGEEQELEVDFEGRRVSYDHTDLDEIVLAYAASIHKAQGSEYPAVIVPITTQHYVLLQKNLLYTAVTRGKRLVVLVGTRKALAIAVKSGQARARYSRLAERLARDRPPVQARFRPVAE